MERKPDGEEKQAAEEFLRQRCDALTQQGVSAQEIAEALGRSVRWVRKWRARARQADSAWYEERSRAPHRRRRQVDPDWELAVIEARHALIARQNAGGCAFIGAIGIRRELERRGVAVEGHSLRQIERIIQRSGLAQPRRRRSRSGPKRVYPGPHTAARRRRDLHEVDFVGPLYPRGGTRLEVLSRMDIASGEARSWVRTRQTSDVACECLWDDWLAGGVPRYVQMDNHACFTGGPNDRRRTGSVIRLCLYVGVQPVFIPAHAPFYNAHVESYQGLWQERLWKRQDFTTGEQLQEKLDGLAAELAGYRAYKRQLQSTSPVAPRSVRTLRADLERPQNIPLCWGRIHVIRQVPEDGVIHILRKTIRVPSTLAHDYVWAIIDTRRQTVTVTHRADPTHPAITIVNRPYAFKERARRRPPLPRGCTM